MPLTRYIHYLVITSLIRPYIIKKETLCTLYFETNSNLVQSKLKMPCVDLHGFPRTYITFVFFRVNFLLHHTAM